MTPTTTNPEPTVRGGVVNVPHSTKPTRPRRHQPNTPPTKKRVKTRSDHQVYGGDSSTTIKNSPPPQPPMGETPTSTPAAPPVPPEPEPETDSEN